MAKIHYTNKAVEDLTLIWQYTALKWSVQQADKYYNQIIRSVQRLADNALVSGKKYFQISEGLLGYKSSKHIIFYREYSGNNIKIIRILHGSMDLQSQLKK